MYLHFCSCICCSQYFWTSESKTLDFSYTSKVFTNGKVLSESFIKFMDVKKIKMGSLLFLCVWLEQELFTSLWCVLLQFRHLGGFCFVFCWYNFPCLLELEIIMFNEHIVIAPSTRDRKFIDKTDYKSLTSHCQHCCCTAY